MKRVLIFILLLFPLAGSAQTWDEWFHQEWTHNEYSAQQIYGLWDYLGRITDGIDVVSNGLNAISNITNGNMNLHRDFFGRLKNFNPRIASRAKIFDIIAFQTYIIQDMNKVYDFCRSNENFSAEEMRYIAKVHTNLLILTDANISELLVIISRNGTQMSDSERLNRIDKIHEDLRDQRAFVHAFGNDALLIAREREKEKINIERRKHIHDTH